MPKIEREQLLYLLANCLIYGTAKAELKLTGVSTVLSRMSVDYGGAMQIEMLKSLGLDYEVTPDPFQMIDNFKKIIVDAGLIKPEDFLIEAGSDKLTITASNCPYKLGCSHLVAEGIKEFSCNINVSASNVAKASGKKVIGRSVNDPGNCKIFVELKK